MTIIVPEKLTVVPSGYKIKGQGLYDIKELYMEIYRWFNHYEYAWKETKYRHVEKPGGEMQIEIWWKGVKEVDDYCKFVIELQMQAFVRDVEAEKKGIKQKLQKGSIEFRTGAYIQKNVKKFGKGQVGLVFAKLYEILIRNRLEKYQELLYTEAHKLYGEIKAYLEFYGTTS